MSLDKEQYLNIRGLKIYVRSVGEGQPLVFLHGGPGSEHRSFLPHMLPLANQFTLIFYDQRGCGQSESAANASDYTIVEEVETLEELRQALGIDRLCLIGESWGTMLALLYATKYPERVEKLLLGSAVGLTGEGYTKFGDELERRLSQQDKSELEEISHRLEAGDAELDELFAILDPYYVYDQKTLLRNTKTIRNPAVNQAMHPEIMKHYDVRKDSAKLQNIPITILQGESDLRSPVEIENEFSMYLPHAHVIPVAECGHWVYIEQSDLFCEEIARCFGQTVTVES